MDKEKSTSTEAGGFRAHAEDRGRSRSPLGGPQPALEARRLVHELEVHQFQLEMQNQQLRASRVELEAGFARYSELFDFAPIGYASLSRDQVVLEINHAGSSLLGKPRSQLVGLALGTFLAECDREPFTAVLEAALRTQQKQTCEVELPRSGEAVRHVRLTASSLPRSEPLILLALEDITERKEREERLARTEQALREADRRKDEFLAMLSHELRNPLAPIRNSLYVLARAEPGGDQARNAQVIIDRQVTHLTRLIDDLLDVTRIAHGKIQLQRERLELGDIVRRTMEDHRASFDASGIALEGQFAPESLWVNADPARLVQALSNLLGNALKFTPRGGHVLVNVQREGDTGAVRVRDTGAGIAPEVLQHLFQPFAQAPQTLDRTRGGLGLGLAMVKRLVALHGGSVAIASEGPGRGTELRIALPLASGPASPHAPEPLLSRQRRVLVIEDNQDASETLRDALTLRGHEVEVASDGPSGLARARSFQPEVVICDIGLPDMDGYDVARAFRNEAGLREAYLVALSGYARPDDLHRALDAGFNRHIAKPAQVDEVHQLIANAPSLPRAEFSASPARATPPPAQAEPATT